MINSKEIIIGADLFEDESAAEENKLQVISYEDVLTEIGFGRAQVEVLVAMIFVLINVFNETMGISNVIPAAVCDLNLTSSSKGLLTSMVFFGIMVSSYAWGYLGDVRGRRWVIIWTLLLSTIFTIISVFVSNFALFLACRFMTGFFVAGYSGVLYAYIGEFNVGKYRAAMISWISVAIGISTTIMPLLAMWLLSYDWAFELYPGYEFKPWRLCLLTFAIPGVIAAIWMLRLPESPRFLLSVGRSEEAMEAVRWIYRTNKGNLNGFGVEQLKAEMNPYSGGSVKGIKQLLASIKNQTLPLLKPPYVLPFSVICALQFGTFWIAGGMSLFLPDILNRILQTREKYGRDFRVCEVEELTDPDSNSGNFSIQPLKYYRNKEVCNDDVNVAVFNDILYLGIAYIVAFIVVALVIRPSRRRAIIAGSFLLSAISGAILPFVYPRYLIVMLFCGFILFAGINVSLVNGAAVDIFPINLRSMAVSLGMLFGRFGSTASANVIGNIIDDYCQATYFFSSAVVLVCFMISFLITK